MAIQYVSTPDRARLRVLRIFLLSEGAAFAAAASVHFGWLAAGYEHRKAGIAESVIAAVLLAGLVLTWIRPRSARGIGLGAQGFALAGTLVGIFTIAIGVGPRTAGDIAYHVGIVLALLSGLRAALRAQRTGP